MSTEYMKGRSDAEREVLAHKIARLRDEGTPWDGAEGIVGSLRLVSSATQGRALLRKYRLDTEQGGPVEIRPSYDRYAINPQTGKRMGYREARRTRASGSPDPARKQAVAIGQSPHAHRDGAGDARYAPIRDLVRRIRRERDAAVPDVCASGRGIDADVLVVLRDPGRLGALKSNYLCVYNADATAANQRRLFAAAKLPLEACLFWNAVPWDLGDRNPGGSDLRAGTGYLSELIALIVRHDHNRRPPIVIACGNDAQEACALAGLDAIEICHPSNRGLRGGGVNREPAHLVGLRTAARRLKARHRAPR
jgi:hypothetical protein